MDKPTPADDELDELFRTFDRTFSEYTRKLESIEESLAALQPQDDPPEPPPADPA